MVPRIRRDCSSTSGRVDCRDISAGRFLSAGFDDHVLLPMGGGLLLGKVVLVAQVHLLTVFKVAGLGLGEFALLRVGKLDDIVRLLKRCLFFNRRSTVLNIEARLVQ